ncbi:inner membrane protein [Escherichia coli]|uniref:Inner membrane protein n=1 Tax=Escherichia coli TaxID=562 RepID=A0A376U669_ECOLX|nr:inner membrane protein [Escherichia coli]
MSHVWGLFSHPDREMQVINRENETISHHYTHHVLLMAAIPVICAFIGTTQIGWNFGDGTILKLSWFTGLALAVLFLRRYAGWGRGDGAGHLVDGAQLPAASVTCALHGLRGLRCNSAVFKRSGGALSAGLVVCAGRHGGAVLHRLPALPWYSELPEYQQRGRP